jgi:HlyD family secretion protein
MLKSKWFWFTAAVLFVAAVVSWRYAAASRDSGRVAFDTTPVGRGRIVAKVTATGTLSAIVTVQVGSQVSGTIAALYADYNSKVKKGQLVAKIDDRIFEATVAQARANLVAALGNLAKAKAQAADATRQANRNQELLAQKLVAQADYDTAQATADADTAAVAAADGAVAQAKAQLHQVEVNLAYTDILSPTDGTVISRSVDVGQTVAASLQAPTLFLIAQDLAKMQVDTSVAEADIGKISHGMRATFTVDAYPGERFNGTVRQVRNAPQTVQNVVTYDAVIDVDNPELKLKPGMTANCTFVYAEKDDVLRIPNSAMRFAPPPDLLAKLRGPDATPLLGARGDANPPSTRRRSGGGGDSAGAPHFGRMGGGAASDRKTVWVLRGGKPVSAGIRTGVSDGSQTEIADGDVKEGDLVITDLAAGTAPKPSGAAGQNFPRRLF